MSRNYTIALLAAGGLTAIAFFFAFHVQRGFKFYLRQQLRELKASGDPELQGEDVETMPLMDFGIELPRDVLRKLHLAQFIQYAWFIWVPLVIFLCLGVAWFLPGKKSAENAADPVVDRQ